MATQTLKLQVDQDTTIMVQISHSEMSTDEFIEEAVDIIRTYEYDPEHYVSVKTETTQY